MTEHKNQHFVPRFYLRNFSSDGVGLIGIDVGSGKASRRNIDNLCASFYFYSTGEERKGFEHSTSRLENVQAEIIRKVISGKSLASLSFEDRFYLNILILLMRTRTRASKADAQRLANALFDSLKPYILQTEGALSKGLTRESLDAVKLVKDGANFEGMLLALNGAELIADLDICLLENETTQPFITSDNPVVLYNHLRHNDFGSLGFQSPGLIIILPLNQKMALLLYDSKVNILNPFGADLVHLDRRKDVDEVNRLVALDAESTIIVDSQNDIEYAKSLLEGVSRHRGSEKYKVTAKPYRKGEQEHELLHFHSTGSRMGVRLTFLRVNPRAKRIIVRTIKSLKGNPISLPRDPRIVEIVNKRMDGLYAKIRSLKERQAPK